MTHAEDAADHNLPLLIWYGLIPLAESDPAGADEVPILYGGSCTPDNAAEFFAEPDVDGALVGGASLKAADFLPIIEAAGAR